ncbi:MAG: hypothetical protein M1819_002819 [Sarea resinae]|nr:MAG: hypothetical protein M1819_002819 [Sarea resinae]
MAGHGFDDAWLWIGLGLFSFIALRTVNRQLHEVRRITEVSSDEKQPQVVCQETEDALKLDTLQKLAEGANYDLRGAALKIICERSSKGPTYDLLLEDLAGQNPRLRDRALTALRFLCGSPASHRVSVQSTYTALITCLANLLPHPAPSSTHPRPPSERSALIILVRLLPYNTNDAIAAGLVKRWLAKYPFGATEAQRRATIRQLKTYNSDDVLMSEVVCMLDNNPEGRKQMRQAGLTGSAMGERDDDDCLDTLMVGGDDTAGRSSGMGRRLREESVEEQALRRRRREAMVFSEGGRPLGRNDIIQRDEGVRDEEVERELEQLIDEVRREEEDAETSLHGPSDQAGLPVRRTTGWAAWRPWPLRSRQAG